MMELNKEVRQGLQVLPYAPASGAESSSDESDISVAAGLSIPESHAEDDETGSRVVDLGSVESEAFEEADPPSTSSASSRGGKTKRKVTQLQNGNAAELVFVDSAIKTNGDGIFVAK